MCDLSGPVLVPENAAAALKMGEGIVARLNRLAALLRGIQVLASGATGVCEDRADRIEQIEAVASLMVSRAEDMAARVQARATQLAEHRYDPARPCPTCNRCA